LSTSLCCCVGYPVYFGERSAVEKKGRKLLVQMYLATEKQESFANEKFCASSVRLFLENETVKNCMSKGELFT